MQNIDRRVSMLETASGIKGEVYLLRVGDQTLESAVDSWMAANPGKGDPRDWAEITVMHVALVSPRQAGSLRPGLHQIEQRE